MSVLASYAAEYLWRTVEYRTWLTTVKIIASFKSKEASPAESTFPVANSWSLGTVGDDVGVQDDVPSRGFNIVAVVPPIELVVVIVILRWFIFGLSWNRGDINLLGDRC